MSDVPHIINHSHWEATFLCDRTCGMHRNECPGIMIKPVHIVREALDFITWCVASVDVNSILPAVGNYSDERWIDYIPEPGFVERDGDTWWRYYDAGDDTMHYLQVTTNG